jgi:hypothetical protein
MDKRKILAEKAQTFYNTLNSDELNLELAENLENIYGLREIIKLKARETFEEKKETNRILTFFQPAKSIDDKPKYVYIFAGVGWVVLYKMGIASKFSIVYVYVFLNLVFHWRRQKYCEQQKEFADYKKVNELYHHIINLKKKSYGMETIISRTFNINFNDFANSNKLDYIKFEYLY